MAAGTCVMTVDATDADDPDTDNAVVRYSILEQGAGGMFSINATTGEICTARPGLDREVVGMGVTRGAPGWHWDCGLGDGRTTAPALSRPRHGDAIGGLWGTSGLLERLKGLSTGPLLPCRPWGCTT